MVEVPVLVQAVGVAGVVGALYDARVTSAVFSARLENSFVNLVWALVSVVAEVKAVGKARVRETEVEVVLERVVAKEAAVAVGDLKASVDKALDLARAKVAVKVLVKAPGLIHPPTTVRHLSLLHRLEGKVQGAVLEAQRPIRDDLRNQSRMYGCFFPPDVNLEISLKVPFSQHVTHLMQSKTNAASEFFLPLLASWTLVKMT